MTSGGWIIEAFKWLDRAIYVAGLWIAVWAFLRCRKRGYLMVGIYFALVAFSLIIWRPIMRTIRDHRPPDISERAQQRIVEATCKILVEDGHPQGIAGTYYVNFPFGPIILVTGLWLVARREKQRPNATVGAPI